VLAAIATMVALLVLAAGHARAQSFVEEVSGDACDQARALEVTDDSPQAQHIRRACRLEHFEYRLAAERRQEVAAQEEARTARVQAWVDATQPVRAIRPIAVGGFVASGVATYGLTVSWEVLRQLELDARLGWRKMTCWSQFSSDGADCTRTSIGLGTRWFVSEKDFTPFFGAGFGMQSSHLQIVQTNSMTGQSDLLIGEGRGNSVSASAGLQLSARGLRTSLEYVYEYVFYTGANADDMQKTPNEALRAVWRDSLTQDRHGIRFEVAYAF
jgi:hypothetical protein